MADPELDAALKVKGRKGRYSLGTYELTAEEAAGFGYTVEPGWKVRVTPPPSPGGIVAEGARQLASLLSPEGWQYEDLEFDKEGKVLDYTAISPTGQRMPKARTAALLPPEPPPEMEPVAGPMRGVGMMQFQGEMPAEFSEADLKALFPERFVSPQTLEKQIATIRGMKTLRGEDEEGEGFEQAFEIPTAAAVFDSLRKQAAALPETFLRQIVAKGRTPETERLLNMFFSVEPGAVDKLFRDVKQEAVAYGDLPQLLQESLPFIATEKNVYDLIDYFQKRPEELRTNLVGVGRTPTTEALVRTAFPQITDEGVDMYFAPDTSFKVTDTGIEMKPGDGGQPPQADTGWGSYQYWLDVFRPQGFGPDVTPEARARAMKRGELDAKAMSTLIAGVGDVIGSAGSAARWLGFNDVAETLSGTGQALQRKAPAPMPGEFEFADMLDPEFWATKVVRTVPFALSFLPLAVGGFVGGGAVATALGLGKIGSMIIGGIGGAALSRPLESAMEAGGSYEDALARGKSEAEAKKEADEVFRKNMLMGGADAFEIAIALAPTPKWVPSSLVKRGLVRLARIGGKMVIVGLSEGGEEVYQDMVQRHARGEEWKLDAVSKEVFAIGAAMGVGMGIGGDIVSGVVESAKTNMSTSLKAKFDASVTAAVKQGLSPEQADLQGLEAVAATPEGQSVVQRAIAAAKGMVAEGAFKTGLVQTTGLAKEGVPTGPEAAKPKLTDAELLEQAAKEAAPPVTKGAAATAGDFVRVTILEDGKKKTFWAKKETGEGNFNRYTRVSREGEVIATEKGGEATTYQDLIDRSLVVSEDVAHIDRTYGTLRIGKLPTLPGAEAIPPTGEAVPGKVAAPAPTRVPGVQGVQRPSEAAAAAALPAAPAAEEIKATIEALSSKWGSAKARNSTRAGADLDALEAKGYDTEEAKDSLQEYRDIEREDFDTAEEYSDARTEAWDSFVDSLSSVDKEVEEGELVEAPAPKVEAPTPAATAAEGAAITEDEVSRLKAMGVTDAEIEKMTPQQARSTLAAAPEAKPETKPEIPPKPPRRPPAPPTTEGAEPAPSEAESLPDRARRIHSELESDVNIARKKIADIKTPLPTQSADVGFARLALNDASNLLRKAATIVDRIEKGQEVSEDEIASLQDKVASLKDFYKWEKSSTAEVKQKLVDYIRTQLPLPRQGELLAKVKNVKTEADLAAAIARVSEIAEAQTEKLLRADVIKELKKTTPRIEKGITIGRLTPEIQRVVDGLRSTLLVGLGKAGQGVSANVEAYEAAQRQIVQNIAEYQQGKLSWDGMLNANESLKYTGLFGMSTLQLEETLAHVQELKQTGKDLRREKREAIRAHRDEVVSNSVTEITGGKGIKPGVGVIPERDLAAEKKVLDQPVNSQYGLVNLLDKLGKFARGTKQYQGFLMRFSKLSQRAVNTENAGREATFKTVRDKFREIYGVAKTRDATRLLTTLSNEKIDLGTFKITTAAGVQYVPLKLTRAEMMEAYQLFKNPKNLDTFQKGMHWTPEIMTKIVNTLSAQDIAWADWLQNEFYDSYYDRINPFYQEEYNIDMPKNPDYVPQSRDFDAGETDEVQMLFQDQKRYASVTNKSLKARQENIRPFKFKGVFTVLTNHIVQMEHFMAWAETMHELRSTFGNNDVRTAVRQYHSGDILRRVDDYMNDFARGGVDRAQFLNGLDKLRSNFAVAVLGLKPSIGLQQIWTVGAFMTEMKTKDFVSGVANFWRHPIENYKWMMENSTYLKARYTGGNYERDIRLAQQQGTAKTMSGQGSISEHLLWQVTQGDKFGVMPGWWAKYQAGLKEGLSQQDAMTEADAASERTQNTSELASLSWLQRGSSWGKLLTMFQSQPNKYFRIVADNIRNMQYGRQSKVKGISNLLLVWVVLPMIFQFVGDAFQWKKERQARALILGPLNNILVAGQLIQNAWGWFTGDSFDWQASPALSTVRDFQNFSTKLVKIIGQMKDPYHDIAMDDIVAAVEFLTKGVGQLTGVPTPYLIMVERAIRSGDPRQLVFSKWALEELKSDLPGKTGKLLDKLGEVIEDVTDLPVDKKPPIYTTKMAYSKVKEALSKTLPQDVTEKNGFSPQTVAIAQTITAEDKLNSLPNKKLFEIIDDIESDNTLNYTFSQYYMDYQDRQKITSLAKLKEWDDEHPRFNLGNVTPEQYPLMRQYEALDTKAKRNAFLEKNPGLKINPQTEWLKDHPKDNALLAIHGQAKVMTQAAYDEAQKLIKSLDYPDAAVADFLPPKDVAKPFFEYQDAVEDFSGNSVQARLIRAKNEKLGEWLGLEPIDESVQGLELKVKTYDDTKAYDAFSDKDSPNYKDDVVKDANGKTARDRAQAEFKAGHQTWLEDKDRIDAYSKGTRDKPTDDVMVNKWVDHGILSREKAGYDAEEKLWYVDNPDAHKWALDNKLSKDDGTKWNVPSLRITAKYRKEDAEYQAILDKYPGRPQEEIQEAKDYMAGAGLKGAELAAREAYRKDQRRKKIFDVGGDASLAEQNMEYGEIVDKFGSGSAEAKLFRLEDAPDLNTFGMNEKTLKWQPILDDVRVLRINRQWRKETEEYQAILDKYPGRPDEEIQEARNYLADNEPFRKDRRRKEAYGLVNKATGEKFPDAEVEKFVDYYEKPIKGKRRDRFLVENGGQDSKNPTGFAKAMLDTGKLTSLPDPKKVPAVQWDDLYDTHKSLFDRYDAATTDADRAKVFAEVPTFRAVWYRRKGYGLFFPEAEVEKYVTYNLMPKAGYEQERYLAENRRFYGLMQSLTGLDDIDFSKVPSRSVEAKYNQYLNRPVGDARTNFRFENPDLDAWLLATGKVSKLVDKAVKLSQWDEMFLRLAEQSRELAEKMRS